MKTDSISNYRACRDCVDQYVVEAPVNNNGVKFCPDDGFELESQHFPDRSAQREIMLLICHCSHRNDGCQWTGPVYLVEQHLKSCAFEVEMTCQFEGFNCSFTGTRSEMEKHLATKVVLHNRLVALASLSARRSDDHTQSRKLINRFNRRYEETMKEFTGMNMEELTDDISGSEDVTSMVGEFYNKFERIKNCKDRLDTILTEGERIADHVHQGANASNRAEALDRKSQQLEQVNAGNTKKVHNFAIKTMLFQSTTYNGSYMWKLDNFNARLMDALDTKRNTSKSLELFTPPLYTERFGYKFCAKMILNGGATHEHISLYIIIMKGEYDEALHWPFPYVITATLVNQNSSKSIRHTLVPDKSLPNFRKPTKELNPSIGFARFCSHDSLHIDNFVNSDAIFIKIEVEVPISAYKRVEE